MINKSRTEEIADGILFVLITIPYLAALILTQSFMGFFSIAVFGFLFFGPLTPLVGLILIVAAVVSLVTKTTRFIHGDWPLTVPAIIKELVFILPLAVIVFAFIFFSGGGKL